MMSEGSEKRAGPPVLIAAGSIVGLLIMYLLSAGPIVKLMIKGTLPQEGTLLSWYFTPIIWLYFNVPIIQRFYDWYIPLFGS